jgi:hypothetical protein
MVARRHFWRGKAPRSVHSSRAEPPLYRNDTGVSVDGVSLGDKTGAECPNSVGSHVVSAALVEDRAPWHWEC